MPVSVNCVVPHPPVRNSMHSERHQAEVVAGSQRCTVYVPEHKHSTDVHLHSVYLVCVRAHSAHIAWRGQAKSCDVKGELETQVRLVFAGAGGAGGPRGEAIVGNPYLMRRGQYQQGPPQPLR